MAKISVIIVSHNKPDFVKEAVQSVLDQRFQDWEAFLVDSGVLLEQGFFDYLQDPRIQILPSGETREIAKSKNMASWCFNNILTSGRVTGELILYLCDDDLFYPVAFETFWDFYVAHDRQPQAMYASQDIGITTRDGQTKIIGKRVADRPAGKFCKGRKLDCQVDYLQFCHTRAVLDLMRKACQTDRPHVEDKKEGDHADGIFMEQVGALTKVYNIDVVVSMNRRTTTSINIEYSDNALGRALILLKQKFKGLRRKLAS